MFQRLLSMFALLLGLIACSGKEVQHTVPNAPVYYRLFFNSHEGIELGKHGMLSITSLSIEQSSIGYAGLLFVKSPLVMNKYFVYDLCCPYEVDPKVRVEQSDLLHAKCPKCKSVYGVVENQGLAISGPAANPNNTRRMRAYEVSPISGGVVAHN